MNPDILALCIPIVAIMAPFGYLVFLRIMKFKEKALEAQIASGGTVDQSLRHEMEQLKQELHRLRDTSTQYDISLQQHLEEIQIRLSHVESRNQAGSYQTGLDQQAAPLSVGTRVE